MSKKPPAGPPHGLRPLCPYCQRGAVFLPTSEEIYHGRDFGPLYICRPCQAWVGAHRSTLLPMGRLANAELRALKIATHAAFDPLWRELAAVYPDMNGVYPKRVLAMARSRAYIWLSHHLRLKPEDCHIAAFDPVRCRQALQLIETLKPTAASVRAWIKAMKQESTQ